MLCMAQIELYINYSLKTFTSHIVRATIDINKFYQQQIAPIPESKSTPT